MMNSGVLAIWTDIPEAAEADFNEWYNHEHLAERSGIPGFINGRRYRALDAEPRYLALYDTETVGVLFSQPYLARLDNPTPWTQRIIPQFQNVTRITFNLHQRLGHGCGGFVACLRFIPAPGRENELDSWLTDVPLPAIIEQPAIVGIQLLQADQADDSDTTSEGKLRANWEQGALWTIVIDATDVDALRTVCSAHLSPAILQQHGADGNIRSGTYQLVYALGSYT
jgi:hypothetical protein